MAGASGAAPTEAKKKPAVKATKPRPVKVARTPKPEKTEKTEKTEVGDDQDPLVDDKSPSPSVGADEASPRLLPLGWRVFGFAGGVTFPDEVRQAATGITAELSPVAAAADLVARLEALESTNAGRGAALRLDGKTIECAASVQDGTGRRGHAAGMRRSESPSGVALALYRAGGGTMWGSAADELGKRLGLSQGSLESREARRLYPLDLARLVQSGAPQKMGSLFSLYATPEMVADAVMTGETPVGPARLPVFALVFAPDGTSGLAFSTGGQPASLPGAPSSWDAPEAAPVLAGATAALVFAGPEPCLQTPARILEQLRTTRSLSLSTAAIETKCNEARYLVVSSEGVKTNLEADTFLQIEGGVGEPKSDNEEAPVDASVAPTRIVGPLGTGSGRKPEPPAAPPKSPPALAAPAPVPSEKASE